MPCGAQVVHAAPTAGQPEVQSEDVGRFEHRDPCAVGRGALGDAEPGEVAAEHDDVVAHTFAREQPHAEVVDRVHVRQLGTGDRGTAPARAGGDDHCVGTRGDDRVGVDALAEADGHVAQLELVLEPPQEVGVDVGGGGGVRPPAAEARRGVDQRDRVAAQRRDPRRLHARRARRRPPAPSAAPRPARRPARPPGPPSRWPRSAPGPARRCCRCSGSGTRTAGSPPAGPRRAGWGARARPGSCGPSTRSRTRRRRWRHRPRPA